MIKIKAKIFVSTITILLFITCAYLSYLYISKLPKKVFSYQDIPLGVSMAEVKYILGYPKTVLNKPEDWNKGKGKPMMMQAYASKEEIESSQNGVDDFYDWEYPSSLKRITIGFDSSSKKVSSISCYVDTSKPVEPATCAVNNIQVLDSEETIIKRLGPPSSSSIEGITKTMIYKNFNMILNLTEKKVYRIIIEELH